MQLVNTTSVESHQGFRAFNLFHGDIAQSDADVIVASTHMTPGLREDERTEGRVLDALRRRLGVPLDRLHPLLLVEGHLGTYLPLPEPGTPRVLVLKMPGRRWLAAHGTAALDSYRKGAWAVFGSLAALELSDTALRSVAIPLLGGSRGFEIVPAMRAILDAASRFLEGARRVSRVDFVLYERFQVDEWNAAMNDALDRSFVDTARSGVVRALVNEVLATVQTAPTLQAPDDRQRLRPLELALQAEPLCLQQVASFARVLAEHVVHTIATGKGTPWQGSLLADIEALRKAELVAPWMISHLHSLRIFGNECVHVRGDVAYRPPALEDRDLVAVLASLHRLVQFWIDWRTETAIRRS